VQEKARDMEAGGRGDIIMLTMGDHDFPTAMPIRDACSAALTAGRTGYGSIHGIVPLRDQIAKRATAVHGFEVDPVHVVVSMGGQAALFATAMTCLDPGDEAIVIEPYYATYEQTIRAAGGVPVTVGTSADDGFQPDMATLRAAITPKTRMILCNSPNNPSGAVYTRETLDGIAALCIEHDLWLVSDEVYHSQVYEAAHLSPASLPGMRERTFIVDSMSKSHAMTGWRSGWVICPDMEAADCIIDLFLTSAYGVAPFIQLAMRAALAGGKGPEHEIAQKYRYRRDRAVEALARSKRLKIHPPQAAMYVLMDLRHFVSDAERFAYALLEETGVAVMPGESFGASAAGHIRISLTAPEEHLVEACNRIAAFADTWSDT
jgi:arginine:pyruvate transaminase